MMALVARGTGAVCLAHFGAPRQLKPFRSKLEKRQPVAALFCVTGQFLAFPNPPIIKRRGFHYASRAIASLLGVSASSVRSAIRAYAKASFVKCQRALASRALSARSFAICESWLNSSRVMVDTTGMALRGYDSGDRDKFQLKIQCDATPVSNCDLLKTGVAPDREALAFMPGA